MERQIVTLNLKIAENQTAMPDEDFVGLIKTTIEDHYNNRIQIASIDYGLVTDDTEEV